MNKLTVIDLNGIPIDITDVDAAIMQARAYMEYGHNPPMPRLDEELKIYWTDLHEKLLKLKGNMDAAGRA